MRIILNGTSQLPASLLLFHDGEAATLVYSRVPQNALSAAEQQLWPSEVFADAWLSLLKQLGDLGFHRILLESGARMAGLMLPDIRLWNRFLLLTASKLLGRGLPWSRDLPDDWNHSLHLSRFERIDCDFLVEFDHVYRNNSSSRNHS